ALGGAIAQQHPGEAFVVLVVLLAKPGQRRVGFAAGVTALIEFAAEFALRLLATCKQAQRLVVGAGAGFAGVAVAAFHAVGLPHPNPPLRAGEGMERRVITPLPALPRTPRWPCRHRPPANGRATRCRSRWLWRGCRAGTGARSPCPGRCGRPC